MPVRDPCPVCQQPEEVCRCVDQPIVKRPASLAINSPEGRQSVEDEYRAAALFESKMPGWKYVHTPKGAPKINAILLNKEGNAEGLVYTACRRDVSLQKFRGTWDNEWLVTWAKLKDAAEICRDTELQLIGFLYLVDEAKLLVNRLYDPLRSPCWLVEERRAYTWTPTAANDPTPIERLNSFIKMNKAALF